MEVRLFSFFFLRKTFLGFFLFEMDVMSTCHMFLLSWLADVRKFFKKKLRWR